MTETTTTSPEQIASAEEEAKKLRAELLALRTDLSKEAEAARGKDREALQAELHSVKETLGKVTEQLAAHERDKMPGLEVLDPKKHKTEKDAKDKFSFFNHMKMSIKSVRPDSPIDEKDFAFEFDVLNEFSLKRKGASLPEVVSHASQNVGQDSAGGVFVPMEVSTAIIPELVATTVSGRSGIQFLTGLSGDMSWPKKVSGVTGQWLDTEAEESITTETLAFGSLRMTPHPYAAAVPLTWLSLRQPAISMEAVVRQDMTEKLGLLLDQGLIKGTGQQGQPRGIDTGNWGISTESWSGTVFGSTATTDGATTKDTTLATLRNMHYDLESANALGDGRTLAWIAEPSVTHKLSKVTDSEGRGMYIGLNEPNVRTLLGYPVITSTAMTNGSTSDGFLLFGKFNEAIAGFWGGMEFAVSNAHASNFLTGVVVIRAISTADLVVRQSAAFSSATSLTTT